MFGRNLWISVITLAEMERGLELREIAVRKLRGVAGMREGQKLQEKRGWATELRGKFEQRIVPIDADIAFEWARIAARFPGLRDGDKILGATALVRQLSIATRNVGDFRHFEERGVEVTNPFEDRPDGPEPDPLDLLLDRKPP